MGISMDDDHKPSNSAYFHTEQQHIQTAYNNTDCYWSLIGGLLCLFFSLLITLNLF